MGPKACPPASLGEREAALSNKTKRLSNLEMGITTALVITKCVLATEGFRDSGHARRKLEMVHLKWAYQRIGPGGCGRRHTAVRRPIGAGATQEAACAPGGRLGCECAQRRVCAAARPREQRIWRLCRHPRPRPEACP